MNYIFIVIGFFLLMLIQELCYKKSIREKNKLINQQKEFIDTELDKLKKEFVSRQGVIDELQGIIDKSKDCLDKNHFHDARVILSPAAKKIQEQSQ